MLKSLRGSLDGSESELTDNLPKRRPVRATITKRTQSASPTTGTGVAARLRERHRSPVPEKKHTDRRCLSSSPAHRGPKKTVRPSVTSAPVALTNKLSSLENNDNISIKLGSKIATSISEPEPVVPQVIVTKTIRLIATKKKEFFKLRKNLIMAQNLLIENYAGLKDMEAKVGVPQSDDDAIGEVRLLSVGSWPAHDLLMLLRYTPAMRDAELTGIASQVMNQLHENLDPIPEEILNMAAELMARRIDLLNLLRVKFNRNMNASITECRSKTMEYEAETERLHRMVAETAENLKKKLNHTLSLCRVAWIDREALTKKIVRLQKENLILQGKIEELSAQTQVQCPQGNDMNQQALSEELTKEKAAREALKDVVSAAENMLRVARARITNLERQLKETKNDLDVIRKKHKDREQLYARSKKLMETSKLGEVTIESLTRQRSALELRVKELRELGENCEKLAESRTQDLKARIEALTAKLAEQEKLKKAADARELELEAKVRELDEALQVLRERSVRLVDVERVRCLEYIPGKEAKPSERETEIWQELQVTRKALAKAEEEARHAKVEKDSFLSSLTRIAQEEDPENVKNKMATELLEKEQKIAKLQHALDEERANEKHMEQTIAQNLKQLAVLNLEVKRLRNYNCYVKEEPLQDLQTEIIELRMQVETLSRERTALVTAAATRALMLERNERAAVLFAKMTGARRDLAAVIDRTTEPLVDSTIVSDLPRSLSCICANASETWMALRAERIRVLRLESAIISQRVQLERENRVRTQLERRRALLEREVLRLQHSDSSSVEPYDTTNPRIPSFLGNNNGSSERNVDQVFPSVLLCYSITIPKV